jgi:arginyl-tRNA synthetase
MKLPYWNQLKKLMNEHSSADTMKDTHLGRVTIAVLGQFVAHNLESYEELECEGCVNSWPSQLIILAAWKITLLR